jgi:hypothetical protein
VRRPTNDTERAEWLQCLQAAATLLAASPWDQRMPDQVAIVAQGIFEAYKRATEE